MNVKTEFKQFEMLINGQMKPSENDRYLDAINPSDGKPFAKVANASIKDVQDAINAASEAFEDGRWTQLSVAERGIFLKKLAKLIRKNAKELAELETLDVGKTTKHTTFVDVPTCADTFDYFSNVDAWLKDQENSVDAPAKSITRREPVGVVGCIIPWNYPLLNAAWKMGPALMAGNTIVFKPSPLASASIAKLGELIIEAEFPAGVVNIVTSDSIEVSKEIVSNEKVNMISFTGGTETGKDIMALASKSLKKVSLELGGKSPNIIFADADLDIALGGAMTAIFMNQGQMCVAGSRLLLEASIYDDFLKKLVEKTKAIKIGPATEFDTEFGPVISRAQRDKALTMIEQAVKDGANIECGGKIPEDQPQEGFYIEPTILSNVTNNMEIAQEEIFGPVLCVMKFTDKDEALKIANDSKYGLAAMVWTKDQAKIDELTKKLQCGIVWVNTYGSFYDGASFGGCKQSGFGRELGLDGLLAYTQSKHVCIDQTPGGKPLAAAWF